jgi:hypothetical protein
MHVIGMMQLGGYNGDPHPFSPPLGMVVKAVTICHKSSLSLHKGRWGDAGSCASQCALGCVAAQLRAIRRLDWSLVCEPRPYPGRPFPSEVRSDERILPQESEY